MNFTRDELELIEMWGSYVIDAWGQMNKEESVLYSKIGRKLTSERSL